MAKRRKRRKKPLKLKIKTETLYSVVAVILISLGILVVLSFSGQGVLLSVLNDILVKKFGFSLLFLPFVFISAGLVMFQTKWAFSRPHILLGSIILMFSVMGFFKQGEVGQETFSNLSKLITATGSMVLFFSGLIIAFLIMLQLSIPEIMDLFNQVLPKPKEKLDIQDSLKVSDDEIKKAKGFSIPKLSFGRDKKKDFAVNDAASRADQDKVDEGTAVINKDQKAGEQGQKDGGRSEGLSLSTDSVPVVWEYPPLSLLSNKAGGKADRGDVKGNAQII
ncbi:MAG: hypothetical protein ABFQ62_02140, partial [Patescibacteria group bacterium]